MNGLILLEGPDAAGKTTLAETILKRVPEDKRSYIHLTYIKDNREMWREQYLTLYRASLEVSAGKLVVIDRHWISENFYSDVYRDGTKLRAETRAWDRVLRKMAAITVLCAPDPGSAVVRHARSLQEREEMYESDDRIYQVAQLYRALACGNPNAPHVNTMDHGLEQSYAHQLINKGRFMDRYDTMFYDIDLHGKMMEEVIDELLDTLRKWRATQFPRTLEHEGFNMLGHAATANILFAGEQINPKKKGRWPFIDYGASSRALTEILHSLSFDETKAMWSNAICSYDPDHLKALLEHKPTMKVIAFGETAERSLARQGIQVHHRVLHPSFAKRFARVHVLREQLSKILP